MATLRLVSALPPNPPARTGERIRANQQFVFLVPPSLRSRHGDPRLPSFSGYRTRACDGSDRADGCASVSYPACVVLLSPRRRALRRRAVRSFLYPRRPCSVWLRSIITTTVAVFRFADQLLSMERRLRARHSRLWTSAGRCVCMRGCAILASPRRRVPSCSSSHRLASEISPRPRRFVTRSRKDLSLTL